jgi:hypothetical protein
LSKNFSISFVAFFQLSSLSRHKINSCLVDTSLFASSSVNFLAFDVLPNPTLFPPASIMLKTSIFPSVINTGSRLSLSNFIAYGLNKLFLS